MIPELTVQELKQLMDEGANIVVLDVRRPDEYEICSFSECFIPLDELEFRLSELNPETKTIIHCRSGGRSLRAAQLLQENGFKDVFNLKGGIRAWATEIDTTMAIY